MQAFSDHQFEIYSNQFQAALNEPEACCICRLRRRINRRKINLLSIAFGLLVVAVALVIAWGLA
jgi:hypothetical protein